MRALDTPSRQVLEEIPGRVLTFIRGAATCTPIYVTLEAVGYGKEATDKAWALLHAACEYEPGPSGMLVDRRIQGAMAELDAWDEPNLERIDAITAHEHPDLYDAMMDNLEPATGAASVLVVQRVLERLDAFEQGAPAERALVATLGRRGYDHKERQRLRTLVSTAKEATRLSSARPCALCSARFDESHPGGSPAIRPRHVENQGSLLVRHLR